MGKGNSSKMRQVKAAILEADGRQGKPMRSAPAMHQQAQQSAALAPAPTQQRSLLSDNSQEFVSEEEKRKQTPYRGTLFGGGSY